MPEGLHQLQGRPCGRHNQQKKLLLRLWEWTQETSVSQHPTARTALLHYCVTICQVYRQWLQSLLLVLPKLRPGVLIPMLLVLPLLQEVLHINSVAVLQLLPQLPVAASCLALVSLLLATVLLLVWLPKLSAVVPTLLNSLVVLTLRQVLVMPLL
jgi:hypothetical protein